VLFSETELLATGGTIQTVPATFGWPPEIIAAHRDLIGHEQNAQALFATYDPATRLQTLPRATWLAELAVLASRQDVTSTFRTNVVKRLRRVYAYDTPLWGGIVAVCGDRAIPAALIA